jgi:hypothetical protein
MTWIKGHADVKGNNKVDEEAKKVVKGKMSKAHNLPVYLAVNKLPMSTVAVKQEYERKIKERWKTKWESSPRYPKLSRINPTMPSNKYAHLTEDLWCTQASLLIQFRMGHLALNNYLHRITKSNTQRCPSCWHEEETTHHYLFDCPTWKPERWNMGKKLGHNMKIILYILNSQKGITEMLKYVGRMERLKDTFGEVNHTI